MPSPSGGFAPSPEARRLYLTFDDGPDPQWTPRVLDILAEAAISATFFLIGVHAVRHPALVRRIAAEGHDTGNHTWSHRHPWTLLSPAARKEVRDGTDAIAGIVGSVPKFFRPPHGRLRRCMIEEAERGGQTLVLWNRSAVDWGPLGSAHGVAQRLSAAVAGDIILMHDGGRGINHPEELVKVLPEFLSNINRRSLVPGLLPDLKRSSGSKNIRSTQGKDAPNRYGRE
jgi:peptidoglycan/xylan/chitin deacetylase (PgdA/CDA1 family)